VLQLCGDFSFIFRSFLGSLDLAFQPFRDGTLSCCLFLRSSRFAF
jgi:hypothetical protein